MKHFFHSDCLTGRGLSNTPSRARVLVPKLSGKHAAAEPISDDQCIRIPPRKGSPCRPGHRSIILGPPRGFWPVLDRLLLVLSFYRLERGADLGQRMPTRPSPRALASWFSRNQPRRCRLKKKPRLGGAFFVAPRPAQERVSPVLRHDARTLQMLQDQNSAGR
jgi:hypothetical protein